MSQILELLTRFAEMEGKLNDLLSRSHSIQLATVTDIKESDRTIKVTRESQGGQSQSDWIQAGRSTCYTDEPLPKIGTTVLVAAVEGNPHDLYLLRTLTNATNAPDDRQSNPADDHTEEVLGNKIESVGGDVKRAIAGKETIEVGGEIAITSAGGKFEIESKYGYLHLKAMDRVQISNASGAKVTLFENGTLVLENKLGFKFTLGASNCAIDLNGASLNVINAGNFTVNGASLATVGALDSRGDSLTSRGWT